MTVLLVPVYRGRQCPTSTNFRPNLGATRFTESRFPLSHRQNRWSVKPPWRWGTYTNEETLYGKRYHSRFTCIQTYLDVV